MERCPENQSEWTPHRDEEQIFKVVIVYEDVRTGRRAKLFYDKFIHALKNDCVFSLQLWSFRVLAIPEVRESAADSITQADFVILSLHGEAGLPARIRQWIETWSRQISDRGPALIALVDKSVTKDGQNALTLAYLRSVAQTSRAAFFGHALGLDRN
jgi:hypothetical protein